MAQAHAVKDRRQAHPHIPGARVRKRDPFFGGIAVSVVCSDRKPHEYLNSGVPEETLPRPAYAACPVCGKATAPIIGTAGVMCWECRWDCFMERITALEDQEGIVIAPRREDPASTRARWGFADHIRVAVRHDLDPRVR